MAEKSEEGKKARQRRSSNFTKNEKESLIRIIERYKHIIECKKTNAVSSKSKLKTWDRICIEFNAQSISSEHRPAEKLKLLWENLKRNTRKHLSSMRQETYKTGGESNPVTENLLCLQVKGVMGSTIEPMDNAYDDDFLEDNIEILSFVEFFANKTGQVAGNNWEYIVDVEDITGTPEVIVELQGNQESIRSPLANLPGEPSYEKIIEEGDDWSEWNPTSLKKDRSTFLKISENMKSSTSISEKPLEQERLNKITLQKMHKSCQKKRAIKTPEKSTSLIQAKLDYLTILKTQATEKADLEKKILKNTLVEQRLKIVLLRRQLKMKSRIPKKFQYY